MWVLLTLPPSGKPRTVPSLAQLRYNQHPSPGLVQRFLPLNSLNTPLPDSQDCDLRILSIPSLLASPKSVASKFDSSALELALPLPGRVHLG